MSIKKTLVIGASENTERYSFKAINALVRNNIPTVAIGLRPGNVAGVSFDKTYTAFEDIHTVTLYVGPQNQEGYYQYIVSLKPQRVIFNPGTENPELQQLLKEHHIEPVEACTLVLLATGQY